MRGDDDCDAVPVAQVQDDIDDLAAGCAVEIAGGLAGQQQARPVDQGPCDRYPLLLAAGQMRWQRPVWRAEPDKVEEPGLLVVADPVGHRGRDVVERSTQGAG
jgi:hypothetical protein